jgi:general secretion pathway protein C
MTTQQTPILIHMLGAALACALIALWALRLLAPGPPAVPAPAPAAVVREPDARLAARLFGDVGGGAIARDVNVQVSGVFAAGKDSSAVLSIDGKPARAVLLGQEVAAGTRLVAVHPDGVTLERDGAQARYVVPPAAVAAASAPLVSFRREGATLTAPSVEPAPSARSPAVDRGAAPTAPAVPSAAPPPAMLQAPAPAPQPPARPGEFPIPRRAGP